MRILGLDVGKKRVGVAISDGLAITAQGLCTIDRDNIVSLREIIESNGVIEIIVGVPLNMDGSKGESAKDAILFADRLKKEFSIPVRMWDERLSTLYAEKEMIRGNLSRRKRKGLSDKIAAQLILQNYLDAKRG